MTIQAKTLNFHYNDVVFHFDIGGDEHIISDTIEQSGVWEDNQLSLYKSLIPTDGVFIDIGANVGVNSIFAKLSVPDATVISVEPEPANFELLKRNVERVGLDIRLCNIAIADKPGSIGFVGTGTNAHLAEGPGSIKVQCQTMNDFVGDIDHIDLIKIDVEGFTDLVLTRSSEALSRTSATIIEFSRGDIENRIGKTDLAAIVDHSELLFDRLRPHFAHFYYISRRDGLVALPDTADLFPLMQAEAVVGDVLATRSRMPAISGLSFAFKAIAELMHQNHLRIVEIAEMRSWVESLRRASNTQDVLVARAEADDQSGLDSVVVPIDEQLAQSGVERVEAAN